MAKKLMRLDLLTSHEQKCPSCTTPEVYLAWRELPPQPGMAGFCEDCTPEYKRKMMTEGKCDHPEIRFLRDEDGFVTGSVTQAQAPESSSLDLFGD